MVLIMDLSWCSYQIMSNLEVSRGNHVDRIEILEGTKKNYDQDN